MQLFVLFIDSRCNTLHVSHVIRPSSGARELCVQPDVYVRLVLRSTPIHHGWQYQQLGCCRPTCKFIYQSRTWGTI